MCAMDQLLLPIRHPALVKSLTVALGEGLTTRCRSTVPNALLWDRSVFRELALDLTSQDARFPTVRASAFSVFQDGT
jgi:hypothetical protein